MNEYAFDDLLDAGFKRELWHGAMTHAKTLNTLEASLLFIFAHHQMVNHNVVADDLWTEFCAN